MAVAAMVASTPIRARYRLLPFGSTKGRRPTFAHRVAGFLRCSWPKAATANTVALGLRMTVPLAIDL
jgi:hypothetical protein